MDYELAQWTGPLRGVKVVEIAGIGPGPHAATLLADLGADVIRVEKPGGAASAGPRESDLLTLGRPSVAMDLKNPDALRALRELIATADVLIDELDGIAADRGYPAVLRCDNGPEFACEAMADWAGQRLGLSFIPPGEPWRNGYVESFNSRVRDECLNINIFWSLAQARVVIGDWKNDYNHRRRHSSLGYLAPAVYAAGCTHR